MTLYKIKSLTKKYGKNTAEVVALDAIDLEIPEGKFIVIRRAARARPRFLT